MSAVSLGASAICKKMIAKTIKYNTLDPPAGGFIDNPLTGPLKCAGFDIGSAGAQAAGGLFCDTLHYTTLNPAPVIGLTNPLQVDMDLEPPAPNPQAALLDATTLTSGSMAISVTLNCNTGDAIYSTLEQLDVTAAGTGTGNITCSGQAKGKKLVAGTGGVDLSNSALTVTPGAAAGRAQLNGGFDTAAGEFGNLVKSKMHFTSQVKNTGLVAGSPGTPIVLAPVGNLGYKVYSFVDGVYVLDLCCLKVINTLPFDIHTPYVDVLTNYVIDVNAYCIDNAAQQTSTFETKVLGPPAITGTGTGNFSCLITMTNPAPGWAQVFRVRVKISSL